MTLPAVAPANPLTRRQIRVFISSTFRDMHAERDHLVTVVFPELRERCERLGLEFFDVDLRWGVPEKGPDGEHANSWEYCRQWIERVEPLFVCILGQRYGWVPEVKDFKDSADQRRQEKEPRSITDLEVRHAVLDSRRKRRSYFYLRGAEVSAPDLSDAAAVNLAAEYVDPSPLKERLEDLKAAVRGCGRPVRDYPCLWTGQAFVEMEAFGRLVLEDLWSGVLRDDRYVTKEVWRQALGGDPSTDPRYTDESRPIPRELWEKIVELAKPEPLSPLDAERQQMEAFALSRLRWFQGRTHELRQLTDFIASTDENAPRLAVVAAAPGQGKSALLARLSGSFSTDHCPPITEHSPLVITHFVGTTERSASAHALVGRLLDELDQSGIEWPEEKPKEGQEGKANEEPKLDYNSQCIRLSQRLGEYAGERRIVLLLDALNQLSEGHDLNWLPQRLGSGVRVVVSCVDDYAAKEDGPERKVLRALATRHPAPLRVPLGPLAREDVFVIVKEYLLEYCKELDTHYVEAICAMSQARNPLYLLVMLAELRTLGGNDMNRIVGERIAALPQERPDTMSLFRWVLEGLEKAYDRGPVSLWCMYLALGRAGMASQELADLLARKLGLDSTKAAEEARMTALRIERGLRRYLQRRGGQLDFFHGQLRQAVFEQYEAQTDATKLHGDIADYFRVLADPENNQSWKGVNPRPFLHLAFHLAAAHRFDELCDPLCDLGFIEARGRLGQIYDLVGDYNAALAVLPEFLKENKWLAKRDAAMFAYNKALREYAVVRCAWWFAKERGNLRLEPPYPSLPEILKDDQRPPFPEYVCKRAARLRHFGMFVSAHLGPLTERPSDTLSLAFNNAEGGALAETADRQIDDRQLPWLRRSPRPPTQPLRPQCLRTLEGHSEWVNSVSVSPDGRRAVSGSWDRTVRIWDLETGQCLRILEGHNFWVSCVSVSRDGRRVVSGSCDKTIRIWDLETGECLHTLKGHSEWVNSVSVSPDGHRAISGSDDKTVRLWDLETGECLRTLEGHSGEVSCVCVSPDGCRAVSGSHYNTLRIWNLEYGQCLRVLDGHRRRVNSVSISPDGRRAVSGSCDRTVRIWDLETGECLRILEGHSGEVSCVGVSPDGRCAISGSDDKTVRLWALETGECLRILECTLCIKGVTSVSLSHDGRRAVIANADGTLRLWDLEIDDCMHTLEGHNGSISSVSVTSDGRRAVSGSWDKNIRLWNMETGECRRTLEGHSKWVNSVRVSPDGCRAVSGSNDNTVRLWDLETGECLRTLEGHSGEVSCVCVSLDGRLAISGSDDNTVRLWDLETGECLRILECTLCIKGIKSVSLSPDGRRAVVAGGASILHLWDLDCGEWLCYLKGHCQGVESVSVIPDGRRAVSASTDKTLRLWDLETGECLFTFECHCDRVLSLSVSPDGRRAILGSRDKTLRVWNLESGACLAVYHAGAYVHSVTISSSGDRIVCGAMDGQMHFLTPVNFPPSGPPILTAVRLWLFGDNGTPGRWDEHLTTLCPWCGRRFPVRDDMLSKQIACPLESCGKPLQLNPFVASTEVFSPSGDADNGNPPS